MKIINSVLFMALDKHLLDVLELSTHDCLEN